MNYSRIETETTETAELAKAVRRTLEEKFQQEANVTFSPELVAMVDTLEAELQRGELSEANRAWLAQCGLTPERIQNQMEPEYTPQRTVHVYQGKITVCRRHKDAKRDILHVISISL